MMARTVRMKHSGSVKCEGGAVMLAGQKSPILPRCDAWVEGVTFEVELDDGNFFCPATSKTKITGTVGDGPRRLVQIGGTTIAVCSSCMDKLVEAKLVSL
jgi:hypothetical protein